MKDRLTRGFVAGVAAGIVMNIFSLIVVYFNLTTQPFVYWAGSVVYGHNPPFTQGEIILALFAHLVFTGALGMIFIYLIPQVTSRNFLLKGWLFGILIWFVIYGIAHLFKLEVVIPTPLRTVASNFAGASIYGLTLAAIVLYITEKNRTKV